ncbi:MAG: hypothetical protein JST81_13630 [Bacteroidetes bacterium]|nr:hypothetical protein [Bacteroidota bacterium]
MILNLSTKYQKEIALSFISMFFISGLITAKANNAVRMESYATGNIHFNKGRKQNNASSRRQTVSVKEFGLSNTINKTSSHSLTLPENSTGEEYMKKLNGPLIGGPTQPEMTGFKSVGTDNMVNLFTGDFSYNIPLLDVGGYPVNLFYNSGITMDQEASWVGLGWNINPGTVSRTMRGIPDDFNGDEKIKKTQSMRPDQTWGVNLGGNIEIVGLPLTIGANTGISFNNRLGVSTEFGTSASFNLSKNSGDPKSAGVNFSVALNLSARSGASVTPSIRLQSNQNKSMCGAFSASLGYSSRMGLTNLHVSAEAHSNKAKLQSKHFDRPDYQGSNISFAYPAVTPTIGMPLTRMSFNGSFTLGLEMFSVHPHISTSGFYNKTYIANSDKVREMPAFGMMYMQDGNDNKDALLDFNRIQDAIYTRTAPTIGMPAYSYDIFNISGEGVGGSFRTYRSDLGFVHDPLVETREDAGSIGVEVGVGNGFHIGGNLQYVYTPTSAGEWENSNVAKQAFSFKQPSNTWQSVYFKNPGEKAIPDINYQNAIGGEDLVRLQLNPGGSGSATLAPTLERISPSDNSVLGINPIPDLKKAREKRTQLITTLTAREAARVGLDTAIFSYDPDTTKIIFGKCGQAAGIERIDRESEYRKSHHISEVDVLEQNGKKYVYGLPVYNINQVDVTMGIGNGDTTSQLSTYTSNDNSTSNNQGKDWYYERQEIPPYTHSFLLTEIVSPNYVDVKGDGITEDDMGDAIKFNYSKSQFNFKWRTPASANKASYSEGLKTFDKDDKAHFVYGEREQWYLYTIESKNMVARFYVNPVRSDGRSVADESGGLTTTGNQKLTRIALFSKADLTKFGSSAKPIKTVYFTYTNRLCPDPNHLTNNSTNAAGETGKLTLESVYFTYNGNERQKKNRYVFHYPSDNNPSYNYTDNDRWGNYKPRNDGGPNNPGDLSNADFPYAIQDKAKADKYAAAWTLDSITLPSGGKIGINYESDDYAYVQNRRAANLTAIDGFGSSPSSVGMSSDLYAGTTEWNYVYVHLPVPVSSGTQKELTDRYFTDVKQLFMRLAVNMPPDDDGSHTGFELIPIYVDIEEYGLVTGRTDQAYIKIKLLESGNTPMVQFAFSFMKNFLPHKAYQGYDVSESGGLKAVLTSLAGMFDSFRELTEGEDGKFMHDNKCRNVEIDKSFVRLSNPAGKKLGGGLRVKKVVISDNWNKMTGQYTSTYGQTYKYTTTEMINNVPTEISSGVAAWEPVIGGEENPHREIIRNLNRNKLGPFDYGVTEMPMGEMFFPSPMVGYSRVEVNSIHKDTVKNAAGVSVTEYYTTKDFPFKSSYTALDGAGKVDYETPPILRILHIDLMHRTTLSQGFKIDMNDMNGRVKTEATYSSLDLTTPVSKTTNYYNTVLTSDHSYSFNHNFPVLESADGFINNGVIGRDIELMADFRQHQSMTNTSNLTLNLDFFWIGWFPVPLFNPLSPFYVDEKTYRSSAVTKIVNHYGVLDSVVVIKKGSTVSTKNLVYDAETGNVLLSRTNNEFNKPVYNFTYPAHWAYEGMGLAYKNIDVNFQNLTFRKGILENSIDMSYFITGDELYALSEDDNGPLKNQCDITECSDPYLPKNPAKRIWAVNTGISEGNPHWVFMDRNGNPYTAEHVSIRIIRSGRRNMLDQSVGSVTSLNSPITNVTVSGVIKKKLSFTDNTNIIATSSATFKEKWRVDNDFYPVDSIVRTAHTVAAQTFYDTAHQIMTITKNGNNYSYSVNHFATQSSWKLDDAGHYITRKAWIKFDKLNDFLALNLDPSCVEDVYYSFQAMQTHTSQFNNYCPEDTVNSNHPEVHNGGLPNGAPYSSMVNAKNGWVSFSGVAPYFGNATITQIMEHPWYDYNDHNSWKHAFDQNDLYSSDFVFSKIYDPLPGPLDYYNASHDVYSILPLIKKMMIMKQAQLDVTPAFSFQMFYPSQRTGQQNIKCFVSLGTSCSWDKIAIQFKYYPCEGHIDSIRNGVGYCSSETLVGHYCLSKFDRKAINPYVEGILGNWRLDTTWVYYGERKEKDPAIDIDTRTAGTIVGYNTFWDFHSPFLNRNNNSSSQAVWKWNSAITQYNRKGYEIENTDPLGRFNSGLYGYNQQLPVAVSNNAMVRETMFDGFEDYDYETGNCGPSCKSHRQVSFGDIHSNITDTFHHTGRYSLRVEKGQSFGVVASLVNKDSIDYHSDLRIKIDSLALYDTVIVSQGNGLSRYYFPNRCPSYTRGYQDIGYPSENNVGGGSSRSWRGKLVPKQSNWYSFRAHCDDGYRIKINNSYITYNTGYGSDGTDCNGNSPVWWDPFYYSNIIYLVKGQEYNIEIDTYNIGGDAYFDNLQWRIGCADYEEVPINVFYSENYGSIVVNRPSTPTFWCTHLDTVRATGNVLTDSFSLLKGKKIIVSAWVREGGTDCKCSTYVNNNIYVAFSGSNDNYTLKPTGNIIEGWQRYEEAVMVPNDATAISVFLRNISTTAPVYFDDIRIHPFNANMKSFVYHSSNLRLMAELDENNYASFYEYDDDGTLTRVKKETTAGIKTITETRSALLKQD